MTKFILAALIVTASFQTFAKDKDDLQLWAESKLEINNITHFLNKSNCYQSTARFVGCAEAYNVLSLGTLPDKSNNKIMIMPNDYAKQQTATIIKVLLQEKDYVIAETQASDEEKPKETLRAYSIRTKMEMEAYHKSLLGLFNSKVFIDFEKLSLDLEKPIQSSKKKAFIGIAINQYLKNAYDPHTYINVTEILDKRMSGNGQKFTGIGAGIMKDPEGIRISLVYPNSGAENAGVEPDDVITKINGVAIKDLDLEKAVPMLLGEENTTVTLTILRNGKNLEFKITRKTITIENEQLKTVNDIGQKYLYVLIRQFTKTVCDMVYTKVATARAQNPDLQGIILDLRGNPGGVLDESSCVVDIFAGTNKPAVFVKDIHTGKEIHQKFKSKDTQQVGLPIVVLVNGGSASASEVVSGALQDYRAAWIVGERTFGKGTVQEISPMEIINRAAAIYPEANAIKKEFGLPDGISLAMTIQRFYLPAGTSNQLIGVSPDFTVPFKPDATEDERFSMRESDIFDNALVQVSSARATQRTSVESTNMNNCLGRGLADKKYAESKAAQKRADYQLLKAEETALCAKENGYYITKPTPGFVINPISNPWAH